MNRCKPQIIFGKRLHHRCFLVYLIHFNTIYSFRLLSRFCSYWVRNFLRCICQTHFAWKESILNNIPCKYQWREKTLGIEIFYSRKVVETYIAIDLRVRTLSLEQTFFIFLFSVSSQLFQFVYLHHWESKH